MGDNPYEKIIRMMQTQGATNNSAEVQIGVMTSETSCKVGDLELDKDDLLFNELLVKPQLIDKGKAEGRISINGGAMQDYKTENTKDTEKELLEDFKLKAGDIVAVTKISDETYAVLGRLIRL